MADISGRLLYDGARTANPASVTTGIANVPVILQNTATNETLAVLTDASGNYAFTNVPSGGYRIVEAYGTPASPSPGDFANAVPGSPQKAATPPISFVENPATGATHLDATTPDTLLVTVSGADISGQDILNGPVKYSPVQTILDESVTVLPENLITGADGGTFGSFPQGTPANTGANPNPYTDIGTDFMYTQPNPVGITPGPRQYTVQNIMNDATANVQSTWWRISDHTSGNETGRMMVVNGDVPGAVIFQQRVTVKPGTYYLLSSWILNMANNQALAEPKLGVEVSDANGKIMYSATLGALISVNLDEPEWKQIGTILNSRDNSSLTVRFTSMGPEAFGNDYAIDDISLNEVRLNAYTPVKTAAPSNARPGDTVTYTVTLTNTGLNPLTDVFFKDLVPQGFTFLPGSVVVNGAAHGTADPGAGFTVPQVSAGERLTVIFKASVDTVPAVNPAVNNALIDYAYTPVRGGIPDRFNTKSNDALVNVEWLPPCCWPFLPFRPTP